MKNVVPSSLHLVRGDSVVGRNLSRGFVTKGEVFKYRVLEIKSTVL